jgi:hypothetical protein
MMKTIDNARNLMARIDEEVDGIEIQATERNRIAGALYGIAHDHGKAIVVLVESKLYASAFALVRPLFETYIRAVWIHHCATDDEIQSFVSKDRLSVDVSQMLSAIEQKNDFPETLSQIKKNNFKAMHSYTHGGVFPISRRLTEDSIEPVFGEQEIDEVIRFASVLSFLSFCGITDFVKAVEKIEKLDELRQWLETWCFNQPVQPIADKSGSG